MTDGLGAIRPNHIVAVVVTYNPDPIICGQLLNAIVAQVSQVIIVDNASSRDAKAWLTSRVGGSIELLELPENLGIAEAQNRGIDRARALDATHVILFDHDSIPTEGMVATQLTFMNERVQAGEKIAAVGPRAYDPQRNDTKDRAAFIQIKGGHLGRITRYPGYDVIPVSYLIASGSLISLTTLNTVGDMHGDLFIEYVDIEWGLRARSQGYQSYGLWNALMQHSHGDAPIKIMGRSFAFHSPLRHYYMFRNVVWLCGRPWMKATWRLALAVKALQRFVLYVFFGPSTRVHLRYIWHGLKDGVVGKLGKLSEAKI